MSEKLRLQEPIRSPLETPRLITPLPYRSGTSFLAWAIVNNNQPVPDVFSKMTKIAASGRLGHLRDHGYDRMEPDVESVEAWTKHCIELANTSIVSEGEQLRSWLLGANIPGKARSPLFYFAGAAAYFSAIQGVADNGFKGFTFASPAQGNLAPLGHS